MKRTLESALSKNERQEKRRQAKIAQAEAERIRANLPITRQVLEQCIVRGYVQALDDCDMFRRKPSVKFGDALIKHVADLVEIHLSTAIKEKQ